MNVPLSIKGFSAVAPDFPEIVGLPLYPFAEALFSSLKERAECVGRTFSTSYPYPAEGRGFCNVQEHKLEHFLVLEDFDDGLDSICRYYVNQYEPMNQNEIVKWTFSALLSKALELLGMSASDGVPRLSSDCYGRTIAYWGIQRAVMVSLLQVVYSTESRLGRYQIKRKHADTGNYSNSGYQDSYAKAINNANEQQSTETTIGALRFADYANFMYSSSSASGSYYCNMSNVLEAKFVPASNMGFLLECPATMHVMITYNTTGASTYIFDTFGNDFVEGINNIPVTFDENGCFFSNSYPKYPSGYEQAKYGWQGNGGLVFDLSGKFQYGMSWGESA